MAYDPDFDLIGQGIFGSVYKAKEIKSNEMFAIKKIMGIRISEQDEYLGADISECGLEAYPEFISGRTSNVI